MSTLPRIALVVESSRGYGRGLLAGIAKFSRLHGPWAIFWQDRGLGEPVPVWLKSWQGDGIIARVETEEIARAIERTGLPAVDLRGKFADLEMPQIDTDNEAVAGMGFEHLRDRGFRDVAYCGFGSVDYSVQRRVGFEEAARAAGLTCHVYPPDPRSPRGRRAGTSLARIEQDGILFESDLAEWVRSLPRPVGVLACNDVRGQQLLNACRDVGVAVPDDVAVIGVDNDTTLCELCDPPLSSVEPDTERIGYEAATLLDRAMREGRPNERLRHRVPPKGVIVRRSSDILAIEDEVLSRAVRFIRDRACDGITVSDVARHAGVSQTTLNARFRRVLGHTAKKEIVRVRVERATRLLRESSLSQDRIALMCGFNHAAYMNNVFRRETGSPPGAVRRHE